MIFSHFASKLLNFVQKEEGEFETVIVAGEVLLIAGVRLYRSGSRLGNKLSHTLLYVSQYQCSRTI